MLARQLYCKHPSSDLLHFILKFCISLHELTDVFFSSSVVEHALTRTLSDLERRVVYFYCSFDSVASQDPENVLASVLVQLAKKSPELVDGYQDHYRKRTPPGIQELQDQIIDQSKDMECLYIFVDAVNESSSCARLLSILSGISRASNSIRIFLTSTPEIDTQDLLQHRLVMIDMRPQWIENDIRLFVNAKIQQNSTLVNLSELTKSDILKTVTRKADGM